MVSHRVLSQKRLVVNTTCLELAKPSNQQLRLICSQNDYHCLLDETFTKEFEVCREWKWIPGGSCAYINTYAEGNIDGRPCRNSENLICPNAQYSSSENSKYPICYIKKNNNNFTPTTSSFQVSAELTSTSFLETTKKPSKRTRSCMFVFIATAVIIPFLIIAVAYLICTRDNEKAEKSTDDTVESLQKKKLLTDYSVRKQIVDEENLAASTPVIMNPVIQYIEDEFVVFYDSAQSFQRGAALSEWQDRALCTKLYNLLIGEGQKLSLKVTAAIVTRITGKPVENLLAYEIALSLDKKHHPKSGWGNPVCEKDTGTGDDIERLNWIQIFIREKSNTVTVSVEKYMELINIMAKALNRLDPDAEFNEDYKALFNKLTSIEIPLTETVVSKVSE